MGGPKRKNRNCFTLPFKNQVLFVILYLAMVNGTQYEVGDYDYEYYGDYEPLYDDDEYVASESSLAEDYYYDEEQTQARPKKDINFDDFNWMNKTLAGLADPNSGSPASKTTTECENEANQTTAKPTCPPKNTTVATTTAATTSTTTCEPSQLNTTTECTRQAANLNIGTSFSTLSTNKSKLCSPISDEFRSPNVYNDQEEKAKDLRNMVQRLYIAQARVQLEASEIKKAQAIANEAQGQLEESANHVRAITAALQNAQQEVASSAIRAQTAQLQLAAHDQLLFAARQDVDALSSQMVGLQAAEGIAQPKASFDITALMDKLRQPLLQGEKPTPVPTVIDNNLKLIKEKSTNPEYYYQDEYVDY